MASQTKSPGTMADVTGDGSYAWSNPNNAKVSDDIYTAGQSSSTDPSHLLKATNFEFSIPSGATINGILVEIEAYKYRTVSFNLIKIIKADGSFSTTNKTATISTTEAYIPLGSSSDLWGETWDNTKINDIDFGVVVQVAGSGGTAYIDHIRITVYYDAHFPLPPFFI
jgi:hypothetical protein